MKRKRKRCLSVGFTSRAPVALRWSYVWRFAANQLPPPMKSAGSVIVGTGQAFRIPLPFVLNRSTGMTLPGKHPLWSAAVHGFADCGSLTYVAFFVKGLLGSNNSLKSPCRIFVEGTNSKPGTPSD